MQENKLSNIINKLNYSVAEHELIFDEKGIPCDYKYTYVNDFFCELMGVDKENLIGKTVFTLFPKTEIFWLETYSDLIQNGKPKDFVHYAKTFNSYFSVYAFVSRENHFVTSFKDVTAFVKNEDISSKKEELLRTFTASSKAAFFEFDLKKNLFSNSENFENLLGVKEVTIDKYLLEFYRLVHPEDVKRVIKMNNAIVQGKVEEINTEIRFFNSKIDDYIWISYFAYISEKRKFMPVKIQGIVRDITEEKYIQAEHDEHEKLFKEARSIANITTLLYITDIETFEESEELSNFLGIDGLVTLTNFRKIVHPDDLKKFDESTEFIYKNEHGGARYRIIKNGEIRYVESYLYSIDNGDLKTKKISGILRDVTNEEIREQQLSASRQSFRNIFNSSPAGIFTLDEEFNIINQNNKFEEYIGSFDKTLKDMLKEDYNKIIIQIKNDQDVLDYEFTCFCNGVQKHLSLSIVDMDLKTNERYQGTIIDMTERVEANRKIEFLATRDMLTKLYNRNHFEQVTSKLKNKEIGIIVCDIDGLKLINDAFGHLEGDKLLIQFAAHLNVTFPNDVVARIGGDEFAILIRNKTLDELELAEKAIKEYTRELFMFGISIDVSIGYSIKKKTDDFYDAYVVAENIMYRRKLTERSSRKSNALTTIMQTLHEKTHETERHCKRVGELAALLLEAYGNKRQYEVEEIKLIAQVHDIGKIAISKEILDKPSRLSDSEYKTIQTHCESGYKIVSNIINNDDIAIAVLYHHEKYDGTGYPHQLKGENIPLYARIISIADAYDTMVSGRKYQPAISKEEAIKELLRCKGTQFDPNLIDLFIPSIKNK